MNIFELALLLDKRCAVHILPSKKKNAGADMVQGGDALRLPGLTSL